jgi:hypothetical protein
MATTITDEQMAEMRSKAKSNAVVILRRTEKYNEPGMEKIVWEHGRRHYQLRADGLLSIVCPIRDESDISGIGIFKARPQVTKKLYDDVPGVQAGIFTFEVHPCVSFPGDCLPKLAHTCKTMLFYTYFFLEPWLHISDIHQRATESSLVAHTMTVKNLIVIVALWQ